MVIIAIGGGEIREKQTLPIDRAIVRLTGKERPNALFIGTATRDLGGYITTFKKYYQQELGCRVQPLILTRGEPKTPEEIEQRLCWADLVYVGGGNTRYMLGVWAEYGLGAALGRALERGCVLSGLSAGALCWFRQGISDADRLDGLGTEYIELPALGLLPGCFTPHANHPGVQERFERAVREGREGWLADDNAALVWRAGPGGGAYFSLKADPAARVERWRLEDGEIVRAGVPELDER